MKVAILVLAILSIAVCYEHVASRQEALTCLSQSRKRLCGSRTNPEHRYCCGYWESGAACKSSKSTICDADLKKLGPNAHYLMIDFKNDRCASPFNATQSEPRQHEPMLFEPNEFCLLTVHNKGPDGHTVRFERQEFEGVTAHVYEHLGNSKYELRGELQYPSTHTLNPDAIDLDINKDSTAVVLIQHTGEEQGKFHTKFLSLPDPTNKKGKSKLKFPNLEILSFSYFK